MKRLIVNTLCGLSLLLFVTAVILWGRSGWHCDEVIRKTVRVDARGEWPVVRHSIFWSRGKLAFGRMTTVIDTSIYALPPYTYQSTWRVEHREAAFDAPPAGFIRNIGFGTTVDNSFGGGRWTTGGRGADYYRERVVWVPFWFVLIVTALLPMLSWTALRRRRQRATWKATGCCEICGYDLQATPERCPECGTVPPSKNSW